MMLWDGNRRAQGIRNACLVVALLGGCSEDSSPDTSPNDSTPLSPNEDTTQLVAREYCARVCDRAKTCDEDFDRQTCERQCQGQSGVLVNLNPALAEGFYECVDDTACSTVGNGRFFASCLASTAKDVGIPKEGEKLCAALENAADECSFTDYSERACRTAISTYSDGALADAIVCAQKKCDLIFPCLGATLTLPSELNGAPIGFTNQGLSSSGNARTAVQTMFPRSASEAPITAPDATTSAPLDPTSGPLDEDETSESVDPVDPVDPVDTCDECFNNQCGTEMDACLATDACLELYGVLLDCLSEEQGVTSAATDCFLDYVEEHHPTNVESLTALTNLLDCIEGDACTDQCR